MALDQSYINSSYGTLSVNGNIQGCQTFTCGIGGTLYSIKLWALMVWGTPTDNFRVDVYAVDGSHKPTGSSLANKEIDLATFTTATQGGIGGELEIVLNSSPICNLGTEYAIVFKQANQGGDGSNFYRVGHLHLGGTDDYPSGLYWDTDADGSTWVYRLDANSDLQFKTYVNLDNTLWYDINTDLRILQESKNDINSDIRVVDVRTAIRDVNSIIYTVEEKLYDVNCDIRVLEEYDKLYDINCDIRVTSALNYNDVNCDIRVNSEGEIPNALTDIDCDIRVLDKNLYDLNCDIRVVEDPLILYDVNCDIRVRGAGDVEPTPVGLEGFRVYLNGNDIIDVKRDSIQYEWTKNESPATASFRVVRKSDDFNETLAGIAQAVSTNLPIEIKFNGNLRWYGYVMSIDVVQAGESVIVNCLDRKSKVQEELYDISYGRKWEAPEAGNHTVVSGEYAKTGEALISILDQLVANGIISSYSGVPIGIISEYNETQGAPAGTLITDLLDITGNFYWNIAPEGVLEIYESANGTIKNIPSQTENERIHLYDILDYNLKLNDRSNLITELEVNMGTDSEEIRASYKLCSVGATIGAGNVQPAWDRDYDNLFNDYYGSSETIDGYRKIGKLPYITTGKQWLVARDAKPEVGRKWRLASWTEGSFINNNFKAKVIGFDNYAITGWSWGGEYLTLAQPLLEVRKTIKVGDGFLTEYKFKIPNLIGSFYKKEDIAIATESTVFDIMWNGIAGSGAKRKATFSQLGIRDSIGWSVYEEGELVAKSEPGYNDTEYATDKANLMLSRMNDPITEGSIILTFDAFEYYGLKLGKRVNIIQTNETNIYYANNGFPLDIQSIQFDAGSYQVSLLTKHERNFKTSINYR